MVFRHVKSKISLSGGGGGGGGDGGAEMSLKENMINFIFSSV